MGFWEGKKILVTGGAGFLGKHVVSELENIGVKKDNIIVPRVENCDLKIQKNCNKAVLGIDIVIHLAANVGGIAYNLAKPAEIFYDNAAMALNLIDASYRAGVCKFIGIGSACEYPKLTPVPFSECDLWDGYPEESNGAYGLSKRMMLVQSQAYYKQYGFNAIHLLPTNMYGPGDNFDPNSSHVIPALIRRISDAQNRNKSFIEVWGSGEASREFLYVRDAAKAIILAAEKYDKPEPVNIGCGYEIKIKYLVTLVCRLMKFNGEVRWDTSRPDGQLRRSLDISRAREGFGFRAATQIEEGLKETINYWDHNRLLK
ncbi:MAG: GDP-L-fucose synthase [Candidatus Azambacteria bacterium]|nr:GDP-L-fucose synthase [Candidatus Azambacteria bacterium]